MVVTFKCPQCGKMLWFHDSIAGRISLCPACGEKLRLVKPEPPPAPEAAETPGVQEAGAEGASETAAAGEGAAAEQAEAEQPVGVQVSEAAETTEGDGSLSQTPFVESPQEIQEEPAVVEQTLLTHQVAAEMGESHVDVDESDLVQWTQLPEQPERVTPPQWMPQPIAAEQPAQSPPPAAWFPPRAAPTIVAPGGTGVTPRRARLWPTVLFWTGMSAIGVAMVVWAIWLFGKIPSAPTWEQANRDQIIVLKQAAEQLAVSGDLRAAYDKYQELERLTAGQTIDDPALRDEVDEAHRHEEALYQRLMSGEHSAEAEVPMAPQKRPAPVVTPEPQSSTSEPSRPQATAASQPTPPQAAAPAPAPAPVPVPAPAPATPQPVAALAPHPAVHAQPAPTVLVTDAEIGDSIKKGVDYLLAQFQGSQLPRNVQYHDGLDSLVVYALMQAGLATNDTRLDMHGEFMNAAIDAMKNLQMRDLYQTYARSLRVTALSLYDRPRDLPMIRQDVEWLLRDQYGGAFAYRPEDVQHSAVSFWDNSNSQYGLLGVWSGAEVGVGVPEVFWRGVQKHWMQCQLVDGQWSYTQDDRNPRRSMTLAGIASLFVAQDYLGSSDWGDSVGHPPFSPPLAKGLSWLEQGNNSVITPNDVAEMYWSYTLYGLERVGLASGFKYFGAHDWYRERAHDLVESQNEDGSWDASNKTLNTAYALLFLARGRHPIIMNKLRFDGDWANRPRDLANLARFASVELERQLNWQAVPLNHDWHDWTDSPILYMASDKPVDLTDDDRGKIAAYINNGGMLLTQADGDSEEFTKFVTDLGERMFPQYGWTDLPADDPLLTVAFRVTDAPKARIITNGSRILMLHLPRDVAIHWQLRQTETSRTTFEFGINLLLYAAGKSELKNRLTVDEVPETPGAAAATIRLARLRYRGNWDPEPAAWARGDRWFRQQNSLGITVEPTDLADLAASNPAMADWTGTGRITPTGAELTSVRNYVLNGGVLVIDPCGGPNEFYQQLTDEVLPHLFPEATLSSIDPTSRLMTASADGMLDIATPAVREFVRASPDIVQIQPRIMRVGKGHVVVLPLDMVSGILGTDAWGIAGYRPQYALKLMNNLLLWTWDGAHDAP